MFEHLRKVGGGSESAPAGQGIRGTLRFLTTGQMAWFGEDGQVEEVNQFDWADRVAMCGWHGYWSSWLRRFGPKYSPKTLFRREG